MAACRAGSALRAAETSLLSWSARGLVQRGNNVRVISDPCNEAEARLAGCEFTPYKRTPHRLDKSAASTILKDYQAKNPVEGMKIALDFFTNLQSPARRISWRKLKPAQLT